MSLNVAMLGHVDAGKTTLARALSSLASTAAFNAVEGRHNTQDLGYSCFVLDDIRIAIVDCPGHARLVTAVVAASSVFDMALVVVNAVRGMEAQTAEHLLVASLFCPQHILPVISKTDLVDNERVGHVEKEIIRAFRLMKVPLVSPIPRISLVGEDPDTRSLLDAIRPHLFRPIRPLTLPLVLAIDHSFPIKGKGLVLTGTVLSGVCRPGIEIEIPHLKEKWKIKELQSWKETRNEVEAGERVAMVVAQGVRIGRCVVAAPGVLVSHPVWRVSSTRVPFHRLPVKSGCNLHVSVGFEQVWCVVRVGKQDGDDIEALPEVTSDCSIWLIPESPMYTRIGSAYIASRFELHGKGCRIAFYGEILGGQNEVPKMFTRKKREGIMERIVDDRTVICKGLFKKESDQTAFVGMSVVFSSGDVGVLSGAFGASGKTRISVPVSPSLRDAMEPVRVTLFLKRFSDKTSRSYVPEASTSV